MDGFWVVKIEISGCLFSQYLHWSLDLEDDINCGIYTLTGNIEAADRFSNPVTASQALLSSGILDKPYIASVSIQATRRSL